MDNTLQRWSAAEKLVFRFAFLLLGLFMIFFNNGTLPMFYQLMKYPVSLLHVFVPWIGKAWLKLPYPITEFTNGSGDTTYDFVVLLCVAVLALAGTVVWSVLDRKRLHYQRLYYWISVAVRFYVCLMLINYGMVKIIQLQFPAPSLYQLLKPYGESSPMGLAWTFFGFSQGYNVFMGIAELLACLLLFRRTVALGAFVSLMTTANVMAVNYFYDIPVKIVSTALVVMCLFLLAPNFIRLFNFFVNGKTVALRTLLPLEIEKRWKKYAKHTIKYLLITYTFALVFWECFTLSKVYGRNSPKSPLYGAYRVDSYVRNEQVIEREVGDSNLWKVLVMDGPETGAIQLMDDSFKTGTLKADTIKKKITILLEEDPKTTYEFKYEQQDPARFILKGKLNGDSVQMAITKLQFELTERKLNWINENPYNR